MSERPGLITIHENPLTLLGNEVEAGDDAPDVELLDNELKPVKLSNLMWSSSSS